MRRTARALSVAALAGAVVGSAAPAAFADPAAEVSPGTVSPGGSVTVSVSCDPLGGAAPATLEATSQAFEEGTVQLKQVSGKDEKEAGAAYSGTARVPPAENLEGDPDAVGAESAWTVDGTCPAASGGEGKPWSATFTVAGDSGGDSGGGKGGAEGVGGGTDGGTGDTEGGKDGAESGGNDAGSGGNGADGGNGGADGGGGGADGGGGGADAGAEGAGGTDGGWGSSEGSSRPCSEQHLDKAAPYLDTSEPDDEPDAHETGRRSDTSGQHSEDCGSESNHRGVQAGAGGAFTDSVPALVAGGVLIAGAFGGAVYRLRRKTPTAQE
ncbi:hypothetical protein [Streptomyces cyaneus]|uniref:hypothetical protein n=1 Tax=Streptomyces cyaneus TaxID=1904 RepID=UPI0015E881C1|nr:hypothetical protein [Streptomyces cyaneus]